MKSWKFKILFPVILLTVLFLTKLILWDFSISTGKRVGNLTKISKKGKVFSTWEGTIDEGSGDELTSTFSVRSDALGEELYEFEGRQVVLYYEEFLVGWPWETKYNITSWKKNEESQKVITNQSDDQVVKLLGQTMFCTMLGTLYKNEELYKKVKEHMKENNLYLYNQYEKCNE